MLRHCRRNAWVLRTICGCDTSTGSGRYGVIWIKNRGKHRQYVNHKGNGMTGAIQSSLSWELRMDNRDMEIAAYGLQIHPEKTRLVQFKRPMKYPNEREVKPETFDFLGFTHCWGKSLKGNNVVHRKTSGKRFRRSLKAIKEWGWTYRSMRGSQT